MIESAKVVPSDSEEILNRIVHRKETLGLSHRFEAAHLALLFAGVLVRDLSPVVLISAGSVHDRRKRHCQRKVARTEFSTDDRELGRPELTPLGKRGGAVELEIVS